MNRRLMTIIVLSLFIATGASFLVYRVVRTRMIANSGPVVNQIVVASKTLQTGALVRETDVSFANWTGPLPKGFVSTPKDVIGRGVISPIYEGEPVTDNRLAAEGAGGGLAATIPNGMRACAVRVNEVVGVAGFVVPGMRVDVLISGSTAQNAGPRVKTLLQNVEVLSAGHNYQKDNEGKPVEVPVVNLLVTPEQAEVLSLASNETRIQLVLRNPLDTETAKTSGSAMADLFGDEKPAPKPPVSAGVRKPAPPPPPIAQPTPPPAPVLQSQRIEVLNGPKRTEMNIPLPEATR